MDVTRRNFLKGLTGFLAVLAVPSVGVAAQSKMPTTDTKKPLSEKEKLAQLYTPLCEHLEGVMPFAYEDKGYSAIACGVHFKDFENELGNEIGIKIVPKENCSLTLGRKNKNGTFVLDTRELQKIANANWANPKVCESYPNIESVEQVKLKDFTEECPPSNTERWAQPLLWIPNKRTLEKATKCAIDACIQKTFDLHSADLLKLPPSARLVVVDLVYNLGDTGYGASKNFPNFKKALRQGNLEKMKEECTTKNNSRRNTVRQCLMESAILTQKKPTLSPEQIKTKLRESISKDSKYSPSREPGLWREIDKCTDENCTWLKKQMALIQSKAMCLSKTL